MRSKTVLRLAILIAVVLVISVSLFFLQRYQLSRLDDSLTVRAEQAAQRGDLSHAVGLLSEHLRIKPEDADAKEKLAEFVLREKLDNPHRQQAIRLFYEILVRYPGRNDIRRKLAEQLVAVRAFEPRDRPEFAPRALLEVLLSQKRDDLEGSDQGHLHFLLGLCQEYDGDAERAHRSYREAVALRAPERLEAFRRAAVLLRGQLKKPDEADKLIAEMVASDAENPRVYLERGTYRLLFAKTPEERDAAKSDLERALKRLPEEPSIYVDLARIALESRDARQARQRLEEGVKAVPKESSAQLYQLIAKLEKDAGSPLKAIEILGTALKELPDDGNLRWDLAMLLADQGETTKLLVEIQELKRLGASSFIVDFLKARYQVNSREWKSAQQTLTALRSQVESDRNWKETINLLLAQCYERLGQTEGRLSAVEDALRANPRSLPARFALAQERVARGDLDKAIEDYRQLARESPQAMPPLVQLLIVRNQRRLAGNRDWTEAEKLIETIKRQATDSSEWVLLQTDLLAAQGKTAEAQRFVDAEREKNPQRAELWLKSARLLMLQRNLAEAHRLLDEAPKTVNAVDLQLERARLLIAQNAPELPKQLAALAENSSGYPHNDQRRLLESLARAVSQLKDFATAHDLWVRVADLEPRDVGPRLNLIDLAFDPQNTLPLEARDQDVKRQIAKVKELEGADGPVGQFCEIEYTIWQARNADDKAQAARLYDAARRQVNELLTRRPDWSKGHLALAQINELEIERSNREAAPPDNEQALKAKRYEAATHYLRAIELGQRNLAVIRRATELLYLSGHTPEIEKLWDQLGIGGGAGPVLQGQVAAEVLRKGDSSLALELARKAKEADKEDYLKRIQYVQILVDAGRVEDAEVELREAVKGAPNQPDRWVVLVGFLLRTNQYPKAVSAVQEAEQVLKPRPSPALARCYELLASTSRTDPKLKDDAAEWDRKIELELTEILARENENGGQNAEEAGWARRTLARLHLQRSSGDHQQALKAMELVEPIAREVEAKGKEKTPSETVVADDLRVLAEVLDAQNTSAGRQKTREIFERLVAKYADTPLDRYKLAVIYGRDGDWPKARDAYRAVLAQTENSKEPTAAALYAQCLARLTLELLQHGQPHPDEKALAEAGELIEKLRPLQNGSLTLVELEARLHKARNQPEKARELIQNARSKLAIEKTEDQEQVWGLARLAEVLGQTELSETWLRELASRSNQVQHSLALIEFLGRRDKVKEALDFSEEIWRKTANPELLAPSILKVVLSPTAKRDQAYLNRAASLFDSALGQHPHSTILILGLANLREHMGTNDEEQYQKAEALYRRCLAEDKENAVALNNLAWLLALRKENTDEALDLISRAIARQGPDPELLDTRAGISRLTGDSQCAIEDLQEGIALSPSGAKYFHLAQAYLDSGDKESAVEALAKARALKLAETDLHPLEVADYQQLITKLAAR